MSELTEDLKSESDSETKSDSLPRAAAISFDDFFDFGWKNVAYGL